MDKDRQRQRPTQATLSIKSKSIEGIVEYSLCKSLTPLIEMIKPDIMQTEFIAFYALSCNAQKIAIQTGQYSIWDLFQHFIDS